MLKEVLEWISQNGTAAFVAGLMICGVLVAAMRFIAVLVRGWPPADVDAAEVIDDD